MEGCDRICYWNPTFLTCGEHSSSLPKIAQTEQKLLGLWASLGLGLFALGECAGQRGLELVSLTVPVEERQGSVHFCLFLQTQ